MLFSKEIDRDFLKKLVSFVKALSKNYKIILVVGGGSLARDYQKALLDIGSSHGDGLDWVGIYATRSNAELVKLAFGKLAFKKLILDPNIFYKSSSKIFIAGGWKPGRSTDDVAVRLAETYKAKSIYNISNTDYVYSSDPKINSKSKPLTRLRWNEYIKISGKKWNPGLHLPFDPVASVYAKTHALEVIIVSGKDFSNILKAINGEKFKGTTIF